MSITVKAYCCPWDDGLKLHIMSIAKNALVLMALLSVVAHNVGDKDSAAFT